MVNIRYRDFFIVFILLLFVGCTNNDHEQKGSTERSLPVLKNNKVTVAINTTLKSIPIIVAQELGFFKKEGLEVTLNIKQSGVATKKALDEGFAHIAAVPEMIAAYDCLVNSSWQIISSINRNNTNELVARRDHGISSVSDLRGKKIALKKKSGSEYWLQRMLIFNSVLVNDVQVVDTKPVNMAGMLAAGTVDAVVTWYPHAYNAIEMLKDNAFHTSAQLGQEVFWVLIAPKAWISANSELVLRFLRAVEYSVQYITDHPDETKLIAAQFLQLDPTSIENEWPLHTFRLELPQNLVALMEEEIQFKINLDDKGVTPNLLESIYFDALSRLDKASISIVH